ncbi:MAG: hypothetical protein L0Y72_22025 [Gemmataceae bacterium]|nr:hypothetical protein [Gemmataceae bacterium]MCI0741720.1 hypothetical protein [Gemmataceae bacterium]
MLHCLPLLFSALLQVQAPPRDDLDPLFALAATAEPTKALPALAKLVRILDESPVPRSDLKVQWDRWAKIAQEKAKTPENVLQALVPVVNKRVSRQILFHRYLEYWDIERATGLRFVFEAQRGQDISLRSVSVVSDPIQ